MAESRVMSFLRQRAPAITLVAVLLLVSACGSATPTVTPTTSPTATPAGPTPTAPPMATPAPTPPATASPTPGSTDANQAVYAEIEQQVVTLRGLQPKTPVARNLVDDAGLREFITKGLNKDMPADLVKATETLYRELLLMPQDASLEDLFVDLYTSSVGGLYDPESKQLLVLSKSGTIGPGEKAIYAHEYTHALQDQNFDLTALIGDAKDQSDRSLARTTMVEGDAYLTMFQWMQAHLTPAEMGKVIATADPGSEAALAKLPEIVKQSLLFPATSGLGFAFADYGQGGFGAIDKRFAAPPDSTEQILHADKLAAGEKPMVVSFPDDLAARLGSGWKVSLQDTMGEMQLEVLLREGGSANSRDAAAGWGGDRVALLEGPNGAKGVVLDTSWDTGKDAAEFQAALEPLVAKLQASGRSAAVLVPEPDRVVLVSGSSDDVLGRVANVLGLAQ